MTNRYNHYTVSLTTDRGVYEYRGVVARSPDIAARVATELLYDEFSVIGRPKILGKEVSLAESPTRVPAP
ncbi:hypothetical protein [Endozoicomonas sp. ALC066]|uniref:hypothetical protein n=1 Tax=Endozoicomonas sp. ALC066 TaxID=3403078 RepID=UPI003BB80763